MFKIEKNVKIPLSKSKYPFAFMKRGDSFFEPISDGGPSWKKYNAVNYARAYERRVQGVKFFHMYVDGGVRVWRVK